MSTQLDSSIGIKKETVYGTAATVDAFLEFESEDFGYTPTIEQSKAQRYGRRVDAADRRVVTKKKVGGSVEVALLTKGLGKLFEAALGKAVSTLSGTAAYQQLFTPAKDDWLPSYTIQKGVPQLGGSVKPQTYTGCVCSGFELSVKNSSAPTVKFTFAGKGVDTSTALAPTAYPADVEELSFIDGAIAVGGSLTLPTSTALGSGGTSVLNVTEMSFTWDNGIDSGGFNLGGAGERTRPPALGLRAGTGSLTVEYDSDTITDAFLDQTDLSLLLTFAAATEIETGHSPTVQIAIPDIRIEGELAKANGGDVITQTVPFTVLDNRVAAEPIYVVVVTAETTI